MGEPYLLADDLSGALEAGAAFRHRGWRVTLPLGKHTAAWMGGPDELQVISTETRNASDGDAARSVRTVVEAQKAAGATLLFKKIDSTLRGPVSAELAALAEVLSPPVILFCPANPLVGRTVVDGKVRVNGVSLDQTDFRRDPIWPARTAEIRALLAKAEGLEFHALSLEQLRTGPDAALETLMRNRVGGRTRVVVVDAAGMNDLRILVDSAERASPEALLVGSGALCSVLSERHPGRLPRTEVTCQSVPSVLVLCGSRHPASHGQLDHLANLGKAVVLTMKVGEEMGEVVEQLVRALRSARVVALRISGDLTAGDPAAAPVDSLARVALKLTTRHSIGALYLTGGETAWGVCAALGGERLEILSELEPGVVVSRLTRGEAASLTVVTKPGGFGDFAAMERHLSKLVK